MRTRVSRSAETGFPGPSDVRRLTNEQLQEVHIRFVEMIHDAVARQKSTWASARGPGGGTELGEFALDGVDA
ncbi:hypothetical protein CTA1_11478 [Colletotrichum tanaceti]|uniref:Uncharacterized protein n=1 Tax=Colletotrichum tanaceti TaxID=1306861 RepID=A0A4U6XU02_9PEZI|nr:hypothetical protein CTA1_11478 [Colletotrichum tanaceti]